MAAAKDPSSYSESTDDTDDSNELAVVLALTTPMTLAPGSKILVTYDSEIKAILPSGDSLQLQALPPPLFRATKLELHIEPTADLGASFARGWMELPDELKLKVLEFNLVSDSPIECRYAFPAPHDFTLSPILRQHIAMEPGYLDPKSAQPGHNIGRLALEIFYTQNTFRIQPDPCFRRLSVPRVPPSMFRSGIRRLHLVLGLTARHWRFLQGVAGNDRGFNLELMKDIEIRFEWSFLSLEWERTLRTLTEEDASIAFACSGQVDLYFTNDSGATQQSFEGDVGMVRDFVKKRITFAK
jgi:hypothetical protein